MCDDVLCNPLTYRLVGDIIAVNILLLNNTRCVLLVARICALQVPVGQDWLAVLASIYESNGKVAISTSCPTKALSAGMMSFGHIKYKVRISKSV